MMETKPPVLARGARPAAFLWRGGRSALYQEGSPDTLGKDLMVAAVY